MEREKQHLDMEKEWEILRLKREKAAEEEMKIQIKAKEEILLEQLNRLGEEKESKDAENIELRNQLKVRKYLILFMMTKSLKQI